MKNNILENSVVDDFNFLRGVRDRIKSLMNINKSSLEGFSAEIVEVMSEIDVKVCQLMEVIDEQGLAPETKIQLEEKILRIESLRK